MKLSISLHFKYLSIKMNWEKIIFHWNKWNFELIGIFGHTAEYLALGKTLLARLYLTVKVHITYLISVYNLQNLDFLYFLGFLWPWKLTLKRTLNELFLCFFFLYASIFTTTDDEKEQKKKTIKSIFKDHYLIWRETFGNS